MEQRCGAACLPLPCAAISRLRPCGGGAEERVGIPAALRRAPRSEARIVHDGAYLKTPAPRDIRRIDAVTVLACSTGSAPKAGSSSTVVD